MPSEDVNLIEALLTIARRGGHVGTQRMLEEMLQATRDGIDFEFDLYKLEEKSDPIGFDGSPWSNDIYFMFCKFRVTPKHSRQRRGMIPDSITIDEGQFIELPAPKKELPRGSQD